MIKGKDIKIGSLSHHPINDPAEGWDGTFRGQPMDPAVFVFVVVVELSDGSTKLYKGDVTLLR